VSRLSLNQITTQHWSLREAVEGCAEAGIGRIAVTREKVGEPGLSEAVRMLGDAGLEVTSLHVGGRFPAATAAERRERRDDNRRAVDEAAELGAPVLSLLAGPSPDRDLDAARGMVEDGIAELIPYAAERAVTLGIEPLHPTFAGDRSVVVTLGEANDLLDRLDSPAVGVTIDAYHVWWDPALLPQVERAAGRIAGYHVDDWPVPNDCPFLSRAMMGDGIIDLPRLTAAVDRAGYAGPIEVEIFNDEIWRQPGRRVLGLVKERYREWIEPALTAAG
jgi:sugar phosphate isomerase/epimerase